jgi:adenylylsulfate reductase subunit B
MFFLSQKKRIFIRFLLWHNFCIWDLGDKSRSCIRLPVKNPTGYSIKKERVMPPVINASNCVGCGTCADICPMDVFTWSKGNVPVVQYGEECWHCNACVMDCPKEAVSLRIPMNYMLLHVDKTDLHA